MRSAFGRLRQRAVVLFRYSELTTLGYPFSSLTLNPSLKVEKKIIKYLAANYGPGPAGNYRRAPISATLMPPNPYATEARLEAEARQKQGIVQPPPGK